MNAGYKEFFGDAYSVAQWAVMNFQTRSFPRIENLLSQEDLWQTVAHAYLEVQPYIKPEEPPARRRAYLKQCFIRFLHDELSRFGCYRPSGKKREYFVLNEMYHITPPLDGDTDEMVLGEGRMEDQVPAWNLSLDMEKVLVNENPEMVRLWREVRIGNASCYEVARRDGLCITTVWKRLNRIDEKLRAFLYSSYELTGRKPRTLKEVCGRGHSMIGANVYINPKYPTTRHCRKCRCIHAQTQLTKKRLALAAAA